VRAPHGTDPEKNGKEKQEIIDAGNHPHADDSANDMSARCMSGIHESGMVRKSNRLRQGSETMWAI
jgi:hypothetical protein